MLLCCLFVMNARTENRSNGELVRPHLCFGFILVGALAAFRATLCYYFYKEKMKKQMLLAAHCLHWTERLLCPLVPVLPIGDACDLACFVAS